MNQREASRAEWRTHGVPPCRDEINSGSLQRIADATEAMAQSWVELRKIAERLRRSNAALRGVITKLKRELGR